MGRDSEWMHEAVATAVKEAVMTSMPAAIEASAKNPATWAALHDGLERHAAARAGGFFAKLVWSILSRGLAFLALGLLVYSVGGWSALSAFWATTHK
jgi:hypothetical protein